MLSVKVHKLLGKFDRAVNVLPSVTNEKGN